METAEKIAAAMRDFTRGLQRAADGTSSKMAGLTKAAREIQPYRPKKD